MAVWLCLAQELTKQSKSRPQQALSSAARYLHLEAKRQPQGHKSEPVIQHPVCNYVEFHKLKRLETSRNCMKLCSGMLSANLSLRDVQISISSKG